MTATASGDPAGLVVLPNVLNDRGSRYAAAVAPARSAQEAALVLAALKSERRFARATHNSWGLILSDGTPVKADDGETGAGMVILRMLERAGVTDHVVIVTRWYGGKRLGGDRFRHVQTCVEAALAARAGA